MTITDDPPETADDPVAGGPVSDVGVDAAPPGGAAPYAEPTGLAGLFASGEHKTIGRVYLACSAIFGLLALVVGWLVALEQIDMATIDVFGNAEGYFRAVVLFRAAIVFLVVVPMFLGVAMVVVPLQLGAPSVAFPRLAAASLWAWLVGSGIFVASILADGGPNAGGDLAAIELTHLALGLTVVGLLAGSISILTTIVAQRPPGMTLFEVPLFSWSMLVAGGVWLLTLPVLVADLALGWVDLRGTDALFFETPVLGNYRYLEWVFEQPQVFAFAIPLLGIVAELVPILFGIRQRLYGVMMGAIGGFGLLTVGAYAQPAFNTDVRTEAPYVVQSLLLVLPLLVLLGGWADTAVRGTKVRSPRPTPQLALGLAAVIMLLAGAAAAALRVLGPAIGGLRELGRNDRSWQDGLDDFLDPLEDLAGTSALSGMFNYVVLAGLLAAVAGLHYWAPKIVGRTLNAPLGYLSALALLGGTVLFSLPEIVNGFLEEPDAPYVGPVDDGVEALNIVVVVGGVLLVVGLLAVGANLAVSARRPGPGPGPDPWGGHTLEWTTASPPPRGNFLVIPVVQSEAPMLDPAPDEEAAAHPDAEEAPA